MADIFISYASKDRPTAKRLADAVEAMGWSVWWDYQHIRGDQILGQVIEQNLSMA